jgi:hypothetical protein
MYLNKSLHEYKQLEDKYFLLQDECEKLRQLAITEANNCDIKEETIRVLQKEINFLNSKGKNLL